MFGDGSWITLPKGAKVVDVRGVALIVRDSIGDAIATTEEDIVTGWWVTRGVVDEDKL